MKEKGFYLLEDNLSQEVEDVNLQINKEIKSENYSFEVKITKITFLLEIETSYNQYVYFYELSSALDADNFQIFLTRDGREYNLFQHPQESSNHMETRYIDVF